MMYKLLKLKNNSRVVLEQIPGVRSCTIGIWVKAGSVSETEQENGYSHFIEHMMFKGTQKRSAKQIAQDMDYLGGQLNAFTSKECTCYYAKVIDEKAVEAIEILTDLFCNSTFDEEELNKERGVVIEEILMSNDSPDDVAHENVSATFFAGTPLAKTILGPKENIEKVSRQDILKYLKRHYYPENIVVACAGSFEEEKLLEALNHTIGNFGLDNEQQEFNAQIQLEEKKRLSMIEKDIEQVHVLIGLPGYTMTDERRESLSILNNVLGGSMSSRMFQKIREERGLAYSVFTYPSAYSKAGMFCAYAGTGADHAQQVTELMLEELELVKKNGITKQEFEQSKQMLRGNYILSMESTSSKMNALGKNLLLGGRVLTEEDVLGRLAKVSWDDVQQTIQDVVQFDKMTGAFTGKIKETAFYEKTFS